MFLICRLGSGHFFSALDKKCLTPPKPGLKKLAEIMATS
jgi:hypothetical protein